MEIRQAYLIERTLTEAELQGFVLVLQHGESPVYLLHPHEALQKLGARLWTGLDPEEQTETNRLLLESLYALGHQPIGRESLAGRLAYRGFQTWYYHKFRINYSLQGRYHKYACYKKLASTYQQLVVYTGARPAAMFAINLPNVEFIYRKVGAGNATGAKSGLALKDQLGAMAKRFARGFAQQRQMQKEPREHLFVLNNAHYRPILNPDQLPGLYTDNMFVGYFLKEQARHFQFVDKLLFEKGAASEGLQPKRGDLDSERQLLNNEWIEWWPLLNPLVLFRIWRFNRHLKKGYRRARRKIKDPFMRLLLQEVVGLHRSTLFFFSSFLAYRRFFQNHRFKSVTLLDEYSPNFRAIVDAARAEGVRTQAIQHGALAAFNPGYSYGEKDARFSPWPDRLLVWGDFWKGFLTRESIYPPEGVITTGQLRTDIIPALKATPLQAGELLGPQVKDKFLILLATQPITDAALRRRAALDTLRVAASLPGSWVVLKPHPRESDAHQYYTDIAREAGCTNFTLLPDFELYLALRISQVLVHCYSTVGVEAVYFGLPAITLDYLQQDPLRFVAEGVALQARDAAELEQHLRALQEGRPLLDPKKQQAYIQKYACAVDGKVGERTAQALLSDELP
jgi:hypothetical protein